MKMTRIAALLIGISILPSSHCLAAKYVTYKNPAMGIAIKVPSNWLLKVTPNAVGFSGPGLGDDRPALGILHSTKEDYSIDQAAEKEYKDRKKPSEWKQMNTTVAGARAIKIITVPKKKFNGTKKILEYYIESGTSYFLIQCIAPTDEWNRYNDTFATILRTFQFLQ
jgi:hypothetical protein